MSATILNLEIQRYTTFGPILINAKDADGVAVPLAGWKAYAHVRKNEKSALLIDLAPVIAVDDTSGLITIPEIPYATTKDMASTHAQWDLILEDAAGKRTPPIIGGRFNINIPITQP